MKQNIMKNRQNLLIALIFTLGIIPEAFAQQGDVPREYREYTNPDEMISFDRRTAFPDAIEVINQFAQEYQGKIVVDRSGYSGPIGISLPAMYWRDALDFILRVQNLVAYETEDMIEILTRADAQAREGGQEAASAAGVSDEIIATTQTREVRINATFFEGNKRALQEIGVDWSTLTNNVPDNIQDFVGDQQSGGGGGGSGGDTGGQLPTTGFDNGFVSVNSKGAQSVSQNVFNALVNFGDIGNGIEVQALFSAFEADNLGQILATPSIKVMDGQSGRIQVGQDFSIKQRDIAGNVTDQFFSTGTILEVTPRIIENNDTTFIYLEIATERSSAQPDPVSTIINKQTATTHSLLLDGESTVIAGLYRTEQTEVRRGIPILKDLPPWLFGLRYLFGFNSVDEQEAELIVLIQAELEETLPERISKSFKSKQELLQKERERHRSEFDTNQTFDDLDELNRIDKDVDDEVFGQDSTQNNLNETIVKNREADLPEESAAEAVNGTPEVASVEKPEIQKTNNLRQEQVNKKDLTRYQNAWKSVSAENMNNSFENLDFYVIGGSFTVRDNATRLFRKFESDGYNAHMLYNPASGYYFVAYAGFEDPDQALEYTRKIQDTKQPDAWLSRIIRESRMDFSDNGPE